MTRLDHSLLSLAAFIVGVLVGAVASNAHAQELPAAGDRRGDRCYTGRMWVDCGTLVPPPPYVTRTWQVTKLAYDDWSAGRVDVIDTDGVCLYVAVRSGEGIAIAAVPKTQLPKGTGCQ